MSRVTRLKHVLKEMMKDNYELPKENQQIVRVVCCRANNLHEVETANVNDKHFLVTMPTKFRKNIWIKRGDYILVETIEEGCKVKGEICKILTSEHIKEYTKLNIWPKRFSEKSNQYSENDVQNKVVDSDSDDLEPNMNRPLRTRNIEHDSGEDDSDEYDSDDNECSSSEED